VRESCSHALTGVGTTFTGVNRQHSLHRLYFGRLRSCEGGPHFGNLGGE